MLSRFLILILIALGCHRAETPPRSTPPNQAPRTLASQGHEEQVAPVSPVFEHNLQDLPGRPNTYRIGGDVKAPIALKRVQPEFKFDGKSHKLVLLIVEAIIDKNGRVQDVKILRGPNNSYARAAIEAIRNWEFAPATLRGKPVDVYFDISVGHVPIEPDT